jgi:CDP-diacylglycerol--serine O-phosphatidyltransferase
MKLFTIPNIITLLNLLCGCLAIVCAFDGNLVWSAYLVGIAAVLDFLDGFVARALKQYSEIGKQLDSLADMVTFGVVPAIVMFKLLSAAMLLHYPAGDVWPFPHANHFDLPGERPLWVEVLPYCAFLIALFSCLRLAKFNIDTRQTDSFIGVPTPANSIFICSLPLILATGAKKFSTDAGPFYPDRVLDFISNEWFLIGATVVMSILLISEIPLFALKFKSFGWKGNEIRWSFLAISVLLLVTLQFVGIPLAIVLYILMSVGNNMVTRKIS